MIVYQADAYIEGEHYREYFATVKEAQRYKPSSDEAPTDVTITRLSIASGRKGVVKALNNVLSDYCVNEK